MQHLNCRLNFHVWGSWIWCPSFAHSTVIFAKLIHVKAKQKYNYFLCITKNKVYKAQMTFMQIIQDSLILDLYVLFKPNKLKRQPYVISSLQHFKHMHNCKSKYMQRTNEMFNYCTLMFFICRSLRNQRHVICRQSNIWGPTILRKTSRPRREPWDPPNLIAPCSIYSCINALPPVTCFSG